MLANWCPHRSLPHSLSPNILAVNLSSIFGVAYYSAQNSVSFYKFDKNVWNWDTRLASFGLRRAARRVGVVGLDSDSGCRLLWVTAAGRRWQFSERDRRVWKSTIRCIVVFSWSWLVDTRHRTSALSTTLCVSSVHYYWNWYVDTTQCMYRRVRLCTCQCRAMRRTGARAPHTWPDQLS